MGILGGNLSIKMAGLGSIFQAPDKNYTVEEESEEYASDSKDSAYEGSGQQAPMGFMASGFFTGRIRNTLHLPA